MKTLTLEQLENAYVEAEREKYKIIKKHFIKPLKAWRNKTVGRVVVQVPSPTTGIPQDVVKDKGRKVLKFQTNEYTRLLQFYFEHFHGFKSRRISSEGKWRADKSHINGGRFIPSTNKGIEDIQVYLPNGVMIAVEVKGPTDRQRPDQVKRQQELGNAYMIATHNFEAFDLAFRERIKLFGL